MDIGYVVLLLLLLTYASAAVILFLRAKGIGAFGGGPPDGPTPSVPDPAGEETEGRPGAPGEPDREA